MAIFITRWNVFQSTLPREERRVVVQSLAPFNRISIHAPTRGATPEPWHKKLCALFQSTLPREERPESCHPLNRIQNFNPRSHERSDAKFSSERSGTAISIHAPTRGATKPMTDKVLNPLFQSTLPREERR